MYRNGKCCDTPMGTQTANGTGYKGHKNRPMCNRVKGVVPPRGIEDGEKGGMLGRGNLQTDWALRIT